MLFLGLRREVGGDWDNYLVMFLRARIYGLPEALTLADPGYMLLSVIVARIGLPLPIVNLVCAAIFVTGLLAFVRAQPRPALALLVAIPVLVVIGGLATTRQSVAVGLLMWSLALYSSGAKRLPSAMVVAAVLFHWTAIVLLPLVLVMTIRRIPLWLIVVAGAVTGIGLALAFATLPFLLGRYGYSGGAALRGSLTVLALVVLFAGWRKLELDDETRRIAAFLASLGLLSLCLIPVLATAGDRLGMYVVPLQMLVFSRAMALAPAGRYRITAQAAIAIPDLVLLASWLAMTEYRPCIAPYRTYLADPDRLRLGAPEPHRRNSGAGKWWCEADRYSSASIASSAPPIAPVQATARWDLSFRASTSSVPKKKAAE